VSARGFGRAYQRSRATVAGFTGPNRNATRREREEAAARLSALVGSVWTDGEGETWTADLDGANGLLDLLSEDGRTFRGTEDGARVWHRVS
jgi:hypothetical protein